MKKGIFLALIAGLLSFGIMGCNSEEQPTEGDAAIIKDTPKNTDPPAKALRERAGASPTVEQAPGGN
ncbi:MAG: hypothetical protein KF836_14050 [Fimbriimonadaceae bacterium]|nr:hypothetical protein [Fimbriimonadaceae bacterium]